MEHIADVFSHSSRHRSRKKPTAQVSINWAIKQAGITCALVGTRNQKQAEANAAEAGWELTDAELSRINRAYTEYIKGTL